VVKGHYSDVCKDLIYSLVPLIYIYIYIYVCIPVLIATRESVSPLHWCSDDSRWEIINPMVLCNVTDGEARHAWERDGTRNVIRSSQADCQLR
jgi:hypothetical protein